MCRVGVGACGGQGPRGTRVPTGSPPPAPGPSGSRQFGGARLVARTPAIPSPPPPRAGGHHRHGGLRGVAAERSALYEEVSGPHWWAGTPGSAAAERAGCCCFSPAAARPLPAPCPSPRRPAPPPPAETGPALTCDRHPRVRSLSWLSYSTRLSSGSRPRTRTRSRITTTAARAIRPHQGPAPRRRRLARRPCGPASSSVPRTCPASARFAVRCPGPASLPGRPGTGAAESSAQLSARPAWNPPCRWRPGLAEWPTGRRPKQKHDRGLANSFFPHPGTSPPPPGGDWRRRWLSPWRRRRGWR